MTGRRGVFLALLPVAIFVIGLLGREVLEPSGSRSLLRPLVDLPGSFGDFVATGDHEMSEGEERMLRADDYLIRTYEAQEGREFGLYVAYYGRQARGASIHSPRNCLPGAGWEPVQHDRVVLSAAVTGTINRYIVEHTSGRRALVYYWYEGRGRREANEYLVKWQMLRDGVFKRRSDEALVRLIFPLPEGWSETEAPAMDQVLVEVADAIGEHVPA